MIELIITIVGFLLLILLVIWLPFLRQSSGQASDDESSEQNFRDETNVELYHAHKAEIERDFEQGSIDEENYQYLLEELNKSLLQDIEGNKNAAKEFDARRKHFSVLWPSVITVFVLAFSFGLYIKNGAYEELSQEPQQTAADAHQQLDEGQQAILRVQELQKQLDEDPENADAWYSLGQGLVGLGDFDNALTAFDQVIRIEGEQADLFGAKAQALYYKNEQKITSDVQQFIDKALSLDPLDPSTNILLGMHNFIDQQYQQAIEYWQRVVDSGRQTVNVGALKEAILEAKNRLSLTGDIPAESAVGPQLRVDVQLTESILAKLSEGEDKVVFIYATPTDGSRMPVAALKINASDLPTTVVLNDARAMSPQAKLSDVDNVHLYAIISQKGGAGIKPGDFKAEQLNISVNSQEVITLLIDRVVE
ncbi:c-type cytochrome biogenesis protein CcmI [Thalassotalea sp. PLHSN55]|uniref:c-type cytochrome biogenesis protein CcmI n=1 Tax=Thalassotalea sp. PLHSN55 TaxID=3435888 RepID=UPI003F82A9CB